MEKRNDFIEMLCPVCKKYLFVDNEDTEKEDSNHNGEQTDFCTSCGWIYDIKQTKDPDLKIGMNEMSLNEYRVWYSKKIKSDPDYNYLDEISKQTPHLCPVCRKHKFSCEGSWEICPVCGWTDDPLMEREPDKWAGNANDLCLNDFRNRYKKLNDGD
ncbi:MAG: hypothetical protein IKE21_03025 [Erysipelotrichaceae bacterium]|nr:hypothetical protein [Erysipelotrichaceae bacterium]